MCVMLLVDAFIVSFSTLFCYRRSPSPVYTDHEEEDMSLSEDEEEPSGGGEFIIDYGHRSLAGQKGND